MSGILKYPEPKTTALGGVAAGNMNAHEAAIVAPVMIMKGCTSNNTAIEAKTGKSIAVVARLDVISVRKLTAAIKKTSNKNKFNPFRETI